MRTIAPIWNNTKVFLLMAALTGMVGVAGQALGGTAGLGLALALAAAGNLAMYFWSGPAALRMYGARVVSEREAPELVRMVERLRQRAGLPPPRVAIAPQAQPNAFATGRSPRHGVVCVTEGLLGTLRPAELEGVIAHELAHIKQRDTLLMTVTATAAGAISHLANLAMFSSFFGGRSDGEEGGGAGQFLAMIVAPLAATLIQLAISRQREFRADALAAEITGQPLALATALAKIEQEARRTPMAVAPAAAALAQVNPLAGAGGALTRLFSTHPPTRDRIARLERMFGTAVEASRVAA
jgi:heat shock protein HtpX